MINEKENRANLKQGSKTLYKFIVTPNELFLSIDIITKETKTELLTKHLLYKCIDLPSSFLLDIRNKIDPSYKSYDLLSKDENFNKTIAEMDKNIRIKAQI